MARPVLATVRLQLTPGWGFTDAARAVPLLAGLGVSHLYLSPVLRAAPGSRHGYDVIDPHHLDLERGGEHAFAELIRTARAHGLGVLLDVVPNHLAGDPRGPAWADVLRHGRSSGFAHWFDLGWASGNEHVRDRILLAMLGHTLDEAIERGDVRLVRSGAEIALRVYDHLLPLSTASIAEITSAVAESFLPPADGARDGQVRVSSGGPDVSEVPERSEVPAARGSGARARYASLAADLRACAAHHDVHGGHRIGCLLGSIAGDDPAIAGELDELLSAMSADAGTLGWVLEQQHYELAHWREGTRRLDRRRFFDVAELVGVRQEDPEVFAATHARVLGLLHHGDVDGLRIDHPDGLSDPTGYLARLRAEIGDAWLLVEKILSEGEELPVEWPVDGTVGYEHGALLDRLLVAPEAEQALTDVVTRHAPEADGVPTDDLDRVIEQGKRDALAMLFEPELRRLGALAVRACDLADTSARVALVEMVVACPVYRTYVRPGATPNSVDAQVLDQLTADALAAVRGDDDAAAAVSAIRAVFDRAERTSAQESLVVRFQQLTSAVTAKGVEDTAFYRIPRLVSLCEVGADPRHWSVTPDEWHAARARALAHHPLGMMATSTHDSKRSLDARCRLAVLSEVPELWAATIDRVTARLDTLLHEAEGPRDRLLELLLVQLVVAAHPAGADRLVPAALKAAREAKHHTSWHDQHEAHERVVERIVHLLLDDPVCRAALDDLLAVVVPAGRVNSLAATLLVVAGPGVPDLYQGSLGWRCTLADPDNRDDLDLAAEERLAAEARHLGPSTWTARAIADDERGVAKAHLVHTCLQLRHVHAGAVTEGAVYTPLPVTGDAAPHAVAHVAGDHTGDRFVVVATRLSVTLSRDGGWRDTEVVLPPGTWTDVLRGDRRVHTGAVRLDDLVGDRPGALLVHT